MEKTFYKLGITRHYKAYEYLIVSLNIYQTDYFRIKNLYSYLSYKFNTKEYNIERNLRYLVNKSIQTGDYDLVINIFYSKDTLPTNKQYLIDLHSYIKHSFSN